MPHRSLECKIYQEQLGRFGIGVPLHIPQPSTENYHVHVGDIGYIDNGQFYTIFNAFADSEETRVMNRVFGTPDGFAPLDPDHLLINEREAYGPQHVFKTSDTHSVGSGIGMDLWTRFTNNLGVQLSISQLENHAAILSIRHSAKFLSAWSKGAMKELMLNQYNSWLSFICEKGCDIELHDMIFVTDCYLTADWAIGVYSEAYTERSIISRFGTLLGITSSASSLSRIDVSIPLRYGPDSSRIMQSLQTRDENVASSSEGKKDQCIFLMGYHMMDRDGLKEIKLKAAAEPRSPDMDRDADSGPSITITDSGSEWDESQEEPWEKEPHLFALQAIFENSDVDIAIVHDSDVYALAEATGYDFKSHVDLSELRQKGSKLEIITHYVDSVCKIVGMIDYPQDGGETAHSEKERDDSAKFKSSPQRYDLPKSKSSPKRDDLPKFKSSLQDGRPYRTVACESCRRARRRCVRLQTKPLLLPCEWCVKHSIECKTMYKGEGKDPWII